MKNNYYDIFNHELRKCSYKKTMAYISLDKWQDTTVIKTFIKRSYDNNFVEIHKRYLFSKKNVEYFEEKEDCETLLYFNFFKDKTVLQYCYHIDNDTKSITELKVNILTKDKEEEYLIENINYENIEIGKELSIELIKKNTIHHYREWVVNSNNKLYCKWYSHSINTDKLELIECTEYDYIIKSEEDRNYLFYWLQYMGHTDILRNNICD